VAVRMLQPATFPSSADRLRRCRAAGDPLAAGRGGWHSRWTGARTGAGQVLDEMPSEHA
jgi:hypothetical protein